MVSALQGIPCRLLARAPASPPTSSPSACKLSRRRVVRLSREARGGSARVPRTFCAGTVHLHSENDAPVRSVRRAVHWKVSPAGSGCNNYVRAMRAAHNLDNTPLGTWLEQ